MRSEQEMLHLILETARSDERIRAVIMNGSRVNPHAPRDLFQDFDVVYLVTDVAPYRKNPAWIRRFGELMIFQMPEDMQDPPPEGDGHFTYLMQFTDGNRIDLSLYPLEQLADVLSDSLSVVLLDKDGLIGSLPPPDESTHLPQPPTAKAFADCCNEFWWVSPYVAKGLWRREILYARHALDVYVRAQLMKMLTWYIGIRTGFSVNPGKDGKYFQRHLEPELWEMLLATYTDASYERTWEALFTMTDLFRRVALQVAEARGFNYPRDDDARVSAHLRRVRELPPDAREY
ncbi:streptomycin adenylyltransferase [Anaerolinea thermolimosa]|uniref:Streptomycin adenylyltransferase n=1 Tax=Anaerolinea thermolimosa TaxID=229919 RepID=A0A7U9PU81_9CHLR|nr:aminoglycoside 6-adenylyltransferase [Anaerolinea thermolimosa]GAP08448.1 streptomycin adenylyltransferase [Anaerolinea thermolimosa]